MAVQLIFYFPITLRAEKVPRTPFKCTVLTNYFFIARQLCRQNCRNIHVKSGVLPIANQNKVLSSPGMFGQS
jgi:hypothetical protein